MGFIVVSKVGGQCKFGYALMGGMLHENPYCGVTKVSPVHNNARVVTV